VAVPMRSKEEAHDYRYFPDPDLVPVLVDEPWIASLRQAMPELPEHRRDRFQQELGLPRYDANVLTAERDVADYYERTLRALEASAPAARENLAKMVSNWVMTDVLRVAGDRSVPIAAFPIMPERLAAMISLILDGTISGKLAKGLFEEMLVSAEEPSAIVRRKGLVQVTDSGAIAACVDTVLGAHDEQVRKYLAGNEKIFGFLVGETMKLMQGKGNPRVVNELLREKLKAMKG
ncbi:MAG TPA: Asp-tRNA(Asn)/Glu-tRNA(Gln) amidotransferase GatCAB subunit B, partial [Bacteroidota bacterium]|nr:Asp-tRNA(Asn)/Glu-tRNA(Gln) amidotransferase GatCAB subunit B [Bacteroidota bacterium]